MTQTLLQWMKTVWQQDWWSMEQALMLSTISVVSCLCQCFLLLLYKIVYSVQTFREAVPEFDYRESIIAQNSNKSRLVSYAGIEYENWETNIENRDALIENRDALVENRDVVIENRVSTLDSWFMRGLRIECQLTFERYCSNFFSVSFIYQSVFILFLFFCKQFMGIVGNYIVGYTIN